MCAIICVILYNMWSGKSLKLLCILPFGMLCLSAISMMFVKNYVGSVYVGWCGGLVGRTFWPADV